MDDIFDRVETDNQSVVACASAGIDTIVVIELGGIAQQESIIAFSANQRIDFAQPRISSSAVNATQNVVAFFGIEEIVASTAEQSIIIFTAVEVVVSSFAG